MRAALLPALLATAAALQQPRQTQPSLLARAAKQQRQREADPRSCFVKNLHFHADEKDLAKAAAKFGKVESVWIPEGKGFGAVTFADAAAAAAAIRTARVPVRGRPAYLVANSRPGGARADAIRFLHAAAKGEGAGATDRAAVLRNYEAAGRPQDARELGIVAGALAFAKARREVLDVLDSHAGGAPTSAVNAALAALSVAGEADARLCRDLVGLAGAEANARTYACAIGACKRGGGYAALGAELLAEAIGSGAANAVVHNEYIALHARAGDWRGALDALEDMFEAPHAAPTEVSLNAAIAACAAAGEVRAARRVHELGFGRAGAEPTKVTFNSLLAAAHVAAKQRRKAGGGDDDGDREETVAYVRETLRRMQQAGLRPDHVTINTALSCYGACGAVDSAKRLFDGAVRDGSATTVTANAYLQALAVAGDAAAAVELVGETMPARGVRADATTWNTAIAACAGVDDAKAVELLDAMPFAGADAAYAFSAALAGLKDARGALAVLRRADAARAATTPVVNAALAALDRAGDHEQLRQLFAEGFDARGLQRDAVSWNTALWSLARPEHAPDAALDLFATMDDPDSRSYGAAMAAAATGGRAERALELLAEAPFSDVALYNDALKACQVAAEPERALELYEKMRSDEHAPDPDAVSATAVVSAAARAGRGFAEAFRVFDALDAPDLPAYNAAISLADKARDQPRAVAYFKALAADGRLAGPDATSFCAAIAACEKREPPAWRTALTLLRGARHRLGGPDAACYIATAQTLVSAGELDRALDLLQDDGVAGFDAQSRYALYRTCQVAAAARGRAGTASELQAAMDREGLRGLRPWAKARLRGRMVAFDNAIDDDAGGVRALAVTAGHAFVTAALPENFRATAPRAAQEASLLHHAEKKALAALLEAGADEDLLVEINFQMCADCHAFFKSASRALGRKLTVREAKKTTHVFEGGACSCGDAWRWEARHVGAGSAVTSR
jgi:hypothetical protein